MAVTRIKNNQITDSTIVANAKVVDYSISASKLANNLTYGSNFTVSGNLTVNGTTTTVDTFNTLIQDPILVLADGQTAGTPTVDIGILGYRGSENSSFIGWKESAGTFMAILSNTTASNTTVNVTSYANFTASTITAQANLSVVGNIVGNANFSGNLTAGNVLTPGIVSAAANITGGNVLTGGLISATSTITSAANITGGNVLTGGLISAAATITGGNLATGGTASATGNITGGNILTAGLISAGGNITSATNVNTPNVVGATGLSVSTGSGNISLSPTSGNIVVNNTYINGVTNPVQNQDVATKIYVDNAVSTQISYHQAVTVATTANLASTTGGSITYTQPNGAANGVGALLTTTGAFNLIDTANVQTVGTRILVKNEGNAVFNGVYTWANATNIVRSTDTDQYGPNSSEELSINDYFFVTSGNVNKGSAYVVDAPTGTITFGTSNIAFAQFSSSQTYTAGNGISLYGTVISTVYDNSTIGINGSNQLYIPANAPLTTPNIGAATGTSLSVTGAVNAGTTISSAGNVTGGNVLTGGLVSATGNITGGNLLTTGSGGAISGSGNITGGNILTGGLVSATSTGTFGNITVGVDSINSANSRITVNSTSADTDIAFNADTVANVFYIDAGTGTASFGSATQTTNAIVAFNSPTSVVMPTGNTAQRPATGVTGMMRFNTNNNALEIYDNAAWTDVGVPVFTVIADQQFNGDGSTVAFTLSSTQTTNSCIVSINGVVQIPGSAYSVAGTDPTCVLTFTEAPASGDLIDVREITTTTTVTSISNSSGNAVVAVSPTSAQTNVTGDLSVSGSILGGNLNSTAITYGTSNVKVVSSGGNVTTSVGGTSNVVVVSSTDVTITGNLTVTGNATLSGNILGDRIQNGTTTIDIQSTGGNANITVGGTSNVAVFATTGVEITGNIQLTGNIIDTGAFYLSTSSNGNITFLPNGTGNVNMSGNVMPTANATANIGSATLSFNTIFAKATSAQYADLAEKYTADAEYSPGTVVAFGGTHEVTLSTQDADRRVAGVVSTNPSYIMNGGLEGANIATVALTGRVPTSVTGTVAKGDLMVSNGDGTARAEADPRAGAIIGKALEDFAGTAGVIEVVIGRF